MNVDTAPEDVRAWIGRTETHHDVVTPVPAAALGATLDRSDPYPHAGLPLRPLRHWLYFLSLYPQSELGSDGHEGRGGFLPPIALPRRMWAGSRLRFEADVCVGATLRRVSTIANVVEKSGRSGRLAFVTVRHEIFERDRRLIAEEHDIVYREPSARSADPAPNEPLTLTRRVADAAREYAATEVLLFRYSALTFNGHRIHYDRRYVTEEEGYPGLVVHGPLLATLLADLAADRNRGERMATFSFRALAPVFDGKPFRACAAPGDDAATSLWIEREDGTIAMEATATFEPPVR